MQFEADKGCVLIYLKKGFASENQSSSYDVGKATVICPRRFLRYNAFVLAGFNKNAVLQCCQDPMRQGSSLRCWCGGESRNLVIGLQMCQKCWCYHILPNLQLENRGNNMSL